MMLEVKHLKRIYKVKNGNQVYALNDVSLKFPETGLVFILGKSGSGKSTLLNIMGGLDKADDGEIIINGKSSKEFSGSEMDSYRNTYLGFIFQEYNILNDFTVKENIALALQLQHKKATDKEIDDILTQVDLQGYGKRKPNELSGGQKQRVAIARALVKEPKIIFGDEPTGALDSNTGKQVFETLKKLSKDKLVVIVSHDRDFAEHFGDRVIELKDGVIISDISKTTVSSQKANEGISIIGDNIIRIDKNHQITVEDLPILNARLQNSSHDMFISTDDHVNEAVCEAARIDKSGNREEFITTDPSKITVNDDKFVGIKSHFSLGHAFKMGARSLKVKPFRLVMTVLLSTIAFTLFGASATLSLFSRENTLKSTIKDGNLTSTSFYIIEKTANGSSKGLTDERIQEIQNETGAKIYTLSSNSSISLNIPSLSNNNDVYHMRHFSGNMALSDTLMDDFGISMYKGSLPTNDTEIIISKYAYYSFKDLGYGYSTNDSQYIAPEDVTEDKIIGKTITTTEYDSNTGMSNPVTYTIKGIYDSNMSSEYEKYRNDQSTLTYGNKDYQYFSQMQYHPNIHNIFIKGKSSSTTSESSKLINNAISVNIDTGNDSYEGQFTAAYYPSHTNILYFDKTKTSLSSHEALVSLNTLSTLNQNNDDNNTKYSITYNDAYISYDGTYPYSMTDGDLYTLLNSPKQAAIYKTTYDKYQDFYTNHLDIIQQMNEGKYPGTYCQGYIGDNDYSNINDYLKYTFFNDYVTNCIANLYSEYDIDTNNEYYSYYYDVLEDYLSYTYSKITNVTGNVIYNIQNNIQDLYGRKYVIENYDNLYSNLKNELERYFSDIATASKSEIRNCLFDLITYNQKDNNYTTLYNAKLKKYLNSIDLSSLSQTLDSSIIIGYTENGYKKEEMKFKIVGLDLDSSNYYNQILVINKEDMTYISTTREENGMFENSNTISNGIVAFGTNFSSLDKFLKYYIAKSDVFNKTSNYNDIPDGSFYLNFSESNVSSVENVASMIVIMTQVFLYIGLAMALFAVLLFYNFISVSINNKKREIGILRAVGAKRTDVFKIFYSEAFIIAIINFIFSTAATIALSIILNNIFKESSSITFNVMNPNILIVVLLLGVSILASIISAILPVTKLANKKPIDAIQNR